MKKLYSFIASILAVATAAGFTACSDDEEYVPATVPGNAQVYFSNALTPTINLVENQTSVEIPVLRQKTDGELTVNIASTDPSGIFNIPQSVTFPAGEATVNLPITFDFAQIEGNRPYPISLKIDEAMTTEYGNATASVTLLYAPWKSIGMCKYQGDFIQTFYNLPNVTYLVEVEESMTSPGLYRLVNPYSLGYEEAMSNALGEQLGGEYDTENDYYMIINATNPNKVYIERSPTGMDFGYGNFTMFSLAGYYIAKDKPSDAEGYYGSVKNGVIRFPKGSLLVEMANYQGGGFYDANNNGKFKLILPGGVDGDYSVSVANAGYIDYVGGTKKAVAEVTMGKDVKEVKMTMIEGVDTESAFAALEEGKLDDVHTFSYSEAPQHADFFVESGKTYTFIAVSYADGEAQERVSNTLCYYDNADFETIGEGNFTDGFVLPLIGQEPFAWPVEIQEHTTDKGIYRVLSPYYPLGVEGDALVIDARDKDHVYVPFAASGVFFEGNGELDWYSQAGYYIDNGLTIADILGNEELAKATAWGTLADGVISLPAEAAGVTFNGDVNSFSANYEPTVIELPGSDTPAPAMVKKATRKGALSIVNRPSGRRAVKTFGLKATRLTK